jgi:multicomponent Na+:H+ antiporter subunit E
MNSERTRPLGGPSPRDGALRLVLLAGLWWLLTGGEAASWVVGAPVVLAATFVSGALTPAVTWRWSWTGALRFAGFFLRQSVVGGVDVAWRALHPRLPLRPGFVALALRLPPGASRVCLANVVSLLPGTLAARLEDDRLVVHTVDASAPVEADVRTVEARVAAMFNVALPPAKGGPA